MDFKNFRVNPNSFSADRPIGVSGFLRVKNDAEFLRVSVESCLPALDELVIVYNACTDNSPEIIRELEKLYPNKVKVYEYEPRIYSHNLSKDEYDFIKSQDSFSPHLLSSYYNFALSKTSYKYAMKIDADQIYDTDELVKLCGAYRSSKRVHLNPIKLICFIYLYFALILYKKSGFKLPFISRNSFAAYREMLIKLVAKYKIPIFFSGINMIYLKNEWFTPLGQKLSSGINILPPYNGLTDHPVFPVSEKIYFEPIEMESYNKLNAFSYTIIEQFVGLKRCLPYGFMWVHLNASRKSIIDKVTQSYTLNSDRFCPSNLFIKTKSKELSVTTDVDILSIQNRKFYSFLHDVMDTSYFAKYIKKYSIEDGILTHKN